MVRQYEHKYRGNNELAGRIVQLWGIHSNTSRINQVNWGSLGITTVKLRYVLSEIGLCLLRPCPGCTRLISCSGGARKFCSEDCRRCVARQKDRECAELRLSVKPGECVCKICGNTFGINKKASRKKYVCSHECHLKLRNWAQSTIYSERRQNGMKNWYNKKGKEYGASWRMKHKTKILANQRKARTGSYGYQYPTREAAIKAGYRSAFEQAVHGNMQSRGITPEYETHKLKWVDDTQHTYTPDFILKKKDGSLMYVEAKGYFDSKTRSKMLFVKKCNPDLDIRMMFQHPKTKLKKGSKTSYGEWADRHGFPWCGPVFPETWVEELAE